MLENKSIGLHWKPYSNLRLVCWCFNGKECICGDEEKVLRHYAGRKPLPPMTVKQRQWCIEQITQSDEGAQPEHLEVLDDADLARTVLDSWLDYCRNMGML